jgi:hypothetical protein
MTSVIGDGSDNENKTTFTTNNMGQFVVYQMETKPQM